MFCLRVELRDSTLQEVAPEGRMMARKFTEAQAHKAWEWFVRQMRIQDWQVQLFVQDDPPEWAIDSCTSRTAGLEQSEPRFKTAMIWVCPSNPDADPLEVLFHEGLHVCAKDTGVENTQEEPPDRIEFLWHRLGALMAKAYRAGVK